MIASKEKLTVRRCELSALPGLHRLSHTAYLYTKRQESAPELRGPNVPARFTHSFPICLVCIQMEVVQLSDGFVYHFTDTLNSPLCAVSTSQSPVDRLAYALIPLFSTR